MKNSFLQISICVLLLTLQFSCKEISEGPSEELISELSLKKGELISCGPDDKQFGSLDFEISCSDSVRSKFNLGVKLLHSFEYDEAEKVFATIIEKEPECAMAYWGVAMSNFHPLWTPPTQPELKKGAKAIEIAQSIKEKTKREGDYINAIASFYKDWEKLDHKTRP